MLAFLQNSWVVGIGGGIVSGIKIGRASCRERV